MMKSSKGERLVDLIWNKNEKYYKFVAPPLNWLVMNAEAKDEEVLELCNE